MELNAGQSHLTPETKRRSVSPYKHKEIGALEIAAEQVGPLIVFLYHIRILLYNIIYYVYTLLRQN